MAAQLTLTWLGADGALEYSVERESITLGLFQEVARVAANSTSYVDLTVLSGVTYCYRVRAASATGYSDYSNVACGAAAAASGSFADDFSRSDANMLGNGWTTVAGSLVIRDGQARSGTVRTMHTAVQASLVGATQSTSATFAPLDNNVGPRFVLLVRYQDPRNYYACYRQTGGSSFVRVSKVVNGVETILKALAVINPLRGQTFTLACQVQGTTVTLTFGAIKLTASDLAFSSGSVGVSMGYPIAGTGTVASHIADNFKATVQ